MNGITNAVFVASSIPIWPIRSISRFPQTHSPQNNTQRPWSCAEHTHNFAVMPKHPQLVAIGAQIRELRSREGYSQEGFAAEIGTTTSRYLSILLRSAVPSAWAQNVCAKYGARCSRISN